ncbi:F0F1 ATP synthase subunit epsilon [Paracrocinitomix mangrovi]|uniref:F0F1 ATP synthase subunit epsilon n=1 Tax=Paracrocinitomix mangrovi TaxID=2862509 RepID=UPI001C8DCF21|nr:F0F1 ATP synthase subunit epsilon [Paracrocinitomix mangrovi]UKN03587.1 F0F1 ATP synthase subunit epsilon [Paracrocinitomix mangrovi]
MILEVITPDAMLFKGQIKQVILPGLDGSFGVLSNHAPMISGLAEGTVKVEQIVDKNREEKEGKFNVEHSNDPVFTFDIKGGVIEVKDNKVMVLAE